MEIKKSVIGVVLLIVFLVIAMTIVGSTIDDVQDAADSSPDITCGGNTTWDSTDNRCEDSTGVTYAATGALPLHSLFSGSGVLLLVLMAAIFIGLMLVILRQMKK